MWSPNKAAMSLEEREYVRLVKTLPCSVCNTRGPSEGHEPKQGAWWLTIALCPDCHRGEVLGLHGQRRMWTVKRMDEWDALAVTVRRMFQLLRGKGNHVG
jgi:hypothetical protein